MHKLLAACVLALFACIPVPTAAAQEVLTTTIENCEPSASLDGTRVFQEIWAGRNCTSNRQITLRFADYATGVLCYVKQEKCVLKSHMNARESALYEELRRYAKPSSLPYKYCIQTDSNATWQLVMLTGKSIDCTPGRHAIREIDTFSGSVCIYHFGKKIDCIPYTAGAHNAHVTQ